MNNMCCKYISNRCGFNDFCRDTCCCDNCCCCNCTDNGYMASDGRISDISTHPVFGDQDTVLWGNGTRYDLFSDGVTVDLTEHDVSRKLVMNDITITKIIMSAVFQFFDGACQPNEIDSSFGLYEALGDSKIFRLIPESKIVFDRKVIPPFESSRSNKTVDGLNIVTNRNNQYLFGLHYKVKTAGDRRCGMVLRPFGSYTYI